VRRYDLVRVFRASRDEVPVRHQHGFARFIQHVVDGVANETRVDHKRGHDWIPARDSCGARIDHGLDVFDDRCWQLF